MSVESAAVSKKSGGGGGVLLENSLVCINSLATIVRPTFLIQSILHWNTNGGQFSEGKRWEKEIICSSGSYQIQKQISVTFFAKSLNLKFLVNVVHRQNQKIVYFIIIIW